MGQTSSARTAPTTRQGLRPVHYNPKTSSAPFKTRSLLDSTRFDAGKPLTSDLKKKNENHVSHLKPQLSRLTSRAGEYTNQTNGRTQNSVPGTLRSNSHEPMNERHRTHMYNVYT